MTRWPRSARCSASGRVHPRREQEPGQEDDGTGAGAVHRVGEALSSAAEAAVTDALRHWLALRVGCGSGDFASLVPIARVFGHPSLDCRDGAGGSWSSERPGTPAPSPLRSSPRAGPPPCWRDAAGNDWRRWHPACRGDFTVATADVADPATVAALVGPGDVLISTVGPFARLGDAAVTAAIERGAHYIDSTGEPAFERRVFEHYGPLAERAGVVLLTAFGYDCVPGNVAAALALEDAGPKAVQVDVGYFVTRGRPSGGTMVTLLGVARAPGFAWRDGALRTERGGARTASFDLGGRRGEGLSFGGSEHLGLPHSYPRLVTIGTYLGWFGPLTKGVSALGAAHAELERLPVVKQLLDRATEGLARRSGGGGPDAAARARMSSIAVGCRPRRPRSRAGERPPRGRRRVHTDGAPVGVGCGAVARRRVATGWSARAGRGVRPRHDGPRAVRRRSSPRRLVAGGAGLVLEGEGQACAEASHLAVLDREVELHDLGDAQVAQRARRGLDGAASSVLPGTQC